jgi:hypothetical protein
MQHRSDPVWERWKEGRLQRNFSQPAAVVETSLRETSAITLTCPSEGLPAPPFTWNLF